MIQLQHGAVGEIFDLVQPGDRRDERSSADIDEYAIGLQNLIADRYRIRRRESTVTFVNSAALEGLQRPFNTVARQAQDVFLAGFDSLHVDGDRTRDRHAEFGGAACQMRGIGTRHQRLGRGATCIDTGSAKEPAFDDRDALSGANQTPGQRGTGLSCSDHDGVIFLHELSRLSVPAGWWRAYSAASRISDFGSCRMTPASGSTSSSQGA